MNLVIDDAEALQMAHAKVEACQLLSTSAEESMHQILIKQIIHASYYCQHLYSEGSSCQVLNYRSPSSEHLATMKTKQGDHGQEEDPPCDWHWAQRIPRAEAEPRLLWKFDFEVASC